MVGQAREVRSDGEDDRGEGEARDSATTDNGATRQCYNLRDLASNLGVGRPLARVTSWAKSRFDKSVLEKLMSFTCSRCKGTVAQKRFSDDLVSNSS